MTVRELRSHLAHLILAGHGDCEVMVEVTDADGDLDVCDLQTARVETRCDGTPCLYLHGDQSESPGTEIGP